MIWYCTHNLPDFLHILSRWLKDQIRGEISFTLRLDIRVKPAEDSKIGAMDIPPKSRPQGKKVTKNTLFRREFEVWYYHGRCDSATALGFMFSLHISQDENRLYEHRCQPTGHCSGWPNAQGRWRLNHKTKATPRAFYWIMELNVHARGFA
jgi:hypothetical protein